MPKLIPLTQGKFAIVDDEDYEWLSQWEWCANKDRNNWYATRSAFGRTIFMHRVILNTPPHLQVDHKDCNGLNNRRSNIRNCTSGQNNRNRRPYANTTSKYKGVCRPKILKSWRACIHYNNKYIHLGYFKNEIDAAKAYNLKAKELFGEFAYLNNVNEA